jgi:hypothetical protein
MTKIAKGQTFVSNYFSLEDGKGEDESVNQATTYLTLQRRG